jgi:hypothetical protein
MVDDEPAPVHEWLPVLANALGAKPPHPDGRTHISPGRENQSLADASGFVST